MNELEYTVIESDEQYDAYCEQLEQLLESGLTDRNSINHYKLLSLLIEDWDRKNSSYIEMNPVQIVNYLLEQHHLKPKDLVEITEYSKSFISEILNYKKSLPKKFIRKVASHFKMDESYLNKEYELRNLKSTDLTNLFSESKLLNKTEE